MHEKIELLKLLEEDGRVSVKDAASMLGVSQEKAQELIEELESSKCVRGYRGVVDWKKVGCEKAAAVVQVKVVPQVKIRFDKEIGRAHV